jgi:histidine ammonia-lyase
MHLLGVDLLSATFWMDLRKTQDSSRTFGQAPTAAWAAFRKLVPFQQDPQTRPEQPMELVATTFLRNNPAVFFYSTGAAPPDGERQVSAGQLRSRD